MVNTVYKDIQKFTEAVYNDNTQMVIELLPTVYANDKSTIVSLCKYSILRNIFDMVETLLNYKEVITFIPENCKKLYCSFEMYLFIIKILDHNFEESMKFISLLYNRKDSKFRKANGFIQRRKQSYRDLSNEDKTAFDLMFL